MSAISLRLPDSLHDEVREMAEKDQVSINQFIMLAVAEKISALKTADYLAQRASRANRQDFYDILAKIPDVPPPDYDRLTDES